MNVEELQISILKAGKTNRETSVYLGISEQAFYNKINGKSEFKNSEILKLSKFLKLSASKVNEIFFDNIVN